MSLAYYSQPPTMMKLKVVWKFCFDLVPKAPDAEILMFRADIMYQNYSARLYFWQPGVEVMTYGFVGVESIDVQKVDRLVCKLRESIVEASAQQI